MIRIGMSTTSVYPLTTADAFRIAAEVGYDGIEIMTTTDESTRDVDGILALCAEYDLPVLSVHAPVFLLTQLMWGRDPRGKLDRTAAMAAELGASTMVVHPPYRWEGAFAREFTTVVRDIAERHRIEVAVENMFALTVAGAPLRVFSPSHDPSQIDCDAMALDFSHASLAGDDALELAHAMGERLRHVHLCDGPKRLADPRFLDEHLVPGHGSQPVDAVLRHLAAGGWSGSVIAEIHTRGARSESERIGLLAETLAFARAAVADSLDADGHGAEELERTDAPLAGERSGGQQ